MTERSSSSDLNRLVAWRPDLPSFAYCSVVSLDRPLTPLHPQEKALLHPLAVAGRQTSFRLGRSAAHQALAALGSDSGPILAGDRREPLWPTDVVGSISHTTEIGMALVAPADRTDGVGIDVENRRHAPELENRIPRPEERVWLGDLPKQERADALLALFSAKESIYKAFYPSVGRYFGFEAALLTPTSSGYAARLVEPLNRDYPPDRTFDLGRKWLNGTVVTWLVLPKSERSL